MTLFFILKLEAPFFEEERVSYDCGKFIMTHAWQEVLKERLQCTGNKLYSRVPHQPTKIYVYENISVIIWLHLFKKCWAPLFV